MVSKSRYAYKDAKSLPTEDGSGRINKLIFIWPPIIMALVSVVVVFGERYVSDIISHCVIMMSWSCDGHVTLQVAGWSGGEHASR